MIHVVLLSGGSGMRLWPLSNSSKPKQFVKVLHNAEGERVSMVQRVLAQIEATGLYLDVTIATSSDQIRLLSQQVGDLHNYVAEPERRDTAPAIMLACAHLAFEQGASMNDPVVVMPIDTFAEQAYYNSIGAVADAVMKEEFDLVLLGVSPTYPSSRFGYILPASDHAGDVRSVKSFKEKPDEDLARTYIAQGGLWNCGVFGFKLGWLRSLTDAYLHVGSYDELLKRYSELPRNSFDYEVVEKAQRIAVVPYAGTWKDLGTWDALCEELMEQTSGPVWLDAVACSNVHVINKTQTPVVVCGIDHVVVVVTDEGILVADKSASPRIKNLAEDATRYTNQRRPHGL